MAHDPQALKLRAITQAEAAQAYTVCVGLDPQGEATPHSAASAGQCYELIGPHGRLIYTISTKAGRCWIHGAAGQGEGMTAYGLTVIEAQALAAGCTSVEFQTLRRGLMKRARAHGYRIRGSVGRGVILGKDL